jgi:predicted DNA-binding transcriptional regulator AlpA
MHKMKLLKPTEVSAKLGITKGALHMFRTRNDSFPEPIKVSPKVFRWDETDIDRWLTAKKERTYGTSTEVG